jgi:uncharacterized protein YbjQ (UPF0145 family)
MIVVTTEGVSHFRIVETKGEVFGVVVRSRGLGGNIMAGLRSKKPDVTPLTAWFKTQLLWVLTP